MPSPETLEITFSSSLVPQPHRPVPNSQLSHCCVEPEPLGNATHDFPPSSRPPACTSPGGVTVTQCTPAVPGRQPTQAGGHTMWKAAICGLQVCGRSNEWLGGQSPSHESSIPSRSLRQTVYLFCGDQAVKRAREDFSRVEKSAGNLSSAAKTLRCGKRERGAGPSPRRAKAPEGACAWCTGKDGRVSTHAVRARHRSPLWWGQPSSITSLTIPTALYYTFQSH